MLPEQEYVGLLIGAARRGIKLADRVHPIALSLRSALVRGMSRREQAALCAALRRVLVNVETFAGDEVDAAEARAGGGA